MTDRHLPVSLRRASPLPQTIDEIIAKLTPQQVWHALPDGFNIGMRFRGISGHRAKSKPQQRFTTPCYCSIVFASQKRPDALFDISLA